MLTIGSLALFHHGHNIRKPTDWDIICWPSEMKHLKETFPIISENNNHVIFEDEEGNKIEAEIAYEYTNQEMLLNLLNNKEFVNDYAEPDIIYALKMSHRFLRNSPHFLKTMEDIRYLRRHVEFPYDLKDWYDKRVSDTYWYEHPSLAKSKDDFFDESVFSGKSPYVYDHDTIHETVKFFNKPAFNYFLDDEVKVNMKKFHTLPYNIKLATVVEESCVLALERAIIPHGADPHGAFLKALEKVCTSISSGSWREFAWENYWEARKVFFEKNLNLPELLQKGIDQGIVKPFKS